MPLVCQTFVKKKTETAERNSKLTPSIRTTKIRPVLSLSSQAHAIKVVKLS